MLILRISRIPHFTQHMDTDNLQEATNLDFHEVDDGSFYEEDSLIRDIHGNLFDSLIQIGGERDDFDNQLLQKKGIKDNGG